MRKRLGVAGILMVLVLGAGIAVPGAAAGDDAGTAGKQAGRQQAVDLNRAGESELMTVPGIGPSLARRIVEFREEHGPFRRVEDLLKVRGIGEKSLEKLKPYFVVGKRK